MAGALSIEFGLYFMMSFEANAIGNLFSYFSRRNGGNYEQTEICKKHFKNGK